MRFDTFYFFAFASIAYLAWRYLPFKGFVLLVASAALYYVEAGRRDSALFLGLILANYALSFVSRRGLALAAAIVLNIGVLAFFKYREFAFGGTAFGEALTSGLFHNVFIPIGISFYTFQGIAYLVDLYRGTAPHERSLARFVLFKAFFPQLIAGPIVRAAQLIPQLRRQWDGKGRQLRLASWALALVLAGLIKKVVFADSLAPFVDDIFSNGPANAFTAWLGAILFGFQIYCDFSGYSDMAVGIAYLFWIRLPFNFRQPYLSASPREFWQRWHITLSTWIRDYLYIPLGGSRGSVARSTLVVILVMALAGLWHGANWTFIAWGLGWGIVIALWRIPMMSRIPAPAGWMLTFAIAVALWVPFRAASLTGAGAYLATMAGGHGAGSADYLSVLAPALAGLAALMLFHVAESRASGMRYLLAMRRLNGPITCAALLAIMAWLVALPKLNNAPFIYFRF